MEPNYLKIKQELLDSLAEMGDRYLEGEPRIPRPEPFTGIIDLGAPSAPLEVSGLDILGLTIEGDPGQTEIPIQD